MCEEKKCNGNCGCGENCKCKTNEWKNEEPPTLFNLDGADDIEEYPEVDDSCFTDSELEGVLCNETGEDEFDEVEGDNCCVCHEEYCEWPNHYVASVDDEGNKYNEEGEFCDDDGNPYPTPDELMAYHLSTEKMFKERYNDNECENKCDECNCSSCQNDETVEALKKVVADTMETVAEETFDFEEDQTEDCMERFEEALNNEALMLADIIAGMLLNSPVEVCFAAKEGVEIPSKRPEDMGFDVKAHFDEHELVIKPHETKLIPTGLYSAVPPCFGLLAREKGSTGAIGMKLGAGVIDSGYRDEIFIAITNENDVPIVITKDETLKKVEVTEDMISYPYKKGIAQLILTFNPAVQVTPLSIEELKAIPSERGEGKLGSTDNL